MTKSDTIVKTVTYVIQKVTGPLTNLLTRTNGTPDFKRGCVTSVSRLWVPWNPCKPSRRYGSLISFPR